ncbi:MAG: hypothetical protein PUJ60_03620 [bacterium]|nr:hypothetical protein [bacterium]MDY4108117.1 hypothetical protein [Bacilli bacterium]
MDISLNTNQIKQLSLSISIIDIVDYIKNNSNDYLKFLEGELESNSITNEEYQKEIDAYKKLDSNEKGSENNVKS